MKFYRDCREPDDVLILIMYPSNALETSARSALAAISLSLLNTPDPHFKMHGIICYAVRDDFNLFRWIDNN